MIHYQSKNNNNTFSMLEPTICMTKRLKDQMQTVIEMSDVDILLKDQLEKHLLEEAIPFRIVKDVHDAISESGESRLYLHELLDGCELNIPEYKPPRRNPELEARITRLKAQQENKKYRDMVRNVDKSVTNEEHVNPSQEVKELNRQLISVINFLVTVGGSFAFGYKATEYAFSGFGNVFAMQLVVGLTLATVVFFADLYFLLKGTW